MAVVLCRSERQDGMRKGLAGLVPADATIDDDPRAPLRGAVEQFRPDVLVSAGYDRIVKPDVLDLLPRAVNIHFGRLPRYRGCWSIPWAILNDDDDIGVTLHDIDASIDGGPIVQQTVFRNDRLLGCRDLYSEAVHVGTKLFNEFIENPDVAALPQDERRATYYPDIFPDEFRIRWKQTTTYVANYLRAAHFPPYPGAYSVFNGVKISFDWPASWRFEATQAAPGTILRIDGRYWITTLNGLIGPETVVVEGHRCNFSKAVLDLSLDGKRL